jgi:hypothetical protein
MKGGDISNETPFKIIVLADVVATLSAPETKRKLFKTEKQIPDMLINLKEVAHIWNVGNKYGISVELAGYADAGWDTALLDSLMETLERRVSNPFNYAELYADPDELVQVLPYRSNLKGVIDLPSRVARYGSYGVELSNL